MSRPAKPPTLNALLSKAVGKPSQPVAFVLAGHNGSGKSTLWLDRLAPALKIPLVNADRLTMSILPPEDPVTKRLPSWATDLRDKDGRWQGLSQEGVQAFMGLIMDKGMPFAFETVFSHYDVSSGAPKTKVEVIRTLQGLGYFVVLLFVGLASADMSILRVNTRKSQGGHDVPIAKLTSRYPRTQAAIKMAAPVADMTLMFDNSREIQHAFSLVRAQTKRTVLYDVRDKRFAHDPDLEAVSRLWLPNVTPKWRTRKK